MNIPIEFEKAFTEECQNKTAQEILELLNSRKVLGFKNMEKYLIMQDFERLCDERGGFCSDCFVKVPSGVIPILMEKYSKEERAIHYIIKGY